MIIIYGYNVIFCKNFVLCVLHCFDIYDKLGYGGYSNKRVFLLYYSNNLRVIINVNLRISFL